METLTMRNQYLGKELTISSTAYFNGEFLDLGKSICKGVTTDGSEFKFQSESGKGHLNLGCVYTRHRASVILDYATLKNLFMKRASDWANKKGTEIPNNIAVAYSGYEISVGEYSWKEDKYEDKYNFISSNLRISASAKHPVTSIRYGQGFVYLFTDYESALIKVAEIIGIEVPDKLEILDEAEMKRQNEIAQLDKQISAVKKQLEELEAKRNTLIQ